MTKIITTIFLLSFLAACATNHQPISEPELKRVGFVSALDNSVRNYFVYLPQGYHSQHSKKWPVMLFLHGNGERGNGHEELGYVLKHGPLYEAWIQKRNLPFVIVSPQLPMFDFDKRGLSYINHRTLSSVPKRLDIGVPERPLSFATHDMISRTMDMAPPPNQTRFPLGWEQIESDLMQMLDYVESHYKVSNKTYLTGLSYGGVGTWHLANRFPKKFDAIAPVVGWTHPNNVEMIAKQKVPTWAFAAGRDSAVKIEYFYAAMRTIEKLGHKIRFTVHEDMGHDAWRRVYAGSDIYNWLLSH